GNAVEVRETGHVEVRIALVDRAHAALVRAQHERPGPDRCLGAVEILESLLGLARENGAARRVRQMVEQRRVRLPAPQTHPAAGARSPGGPVGRWSTSMDGTGSSRWPTGERARNRSSDHFTSSAVTSRALTGGLLWNRTPRRSLNTIVVGFVHSHFSARSGRMR